MKSIRNSVLLFLYLSIIFIAHRLLSFSFLNHRLDSESSTFLVQLVGSLSDIWIAACFGFLFQLFSITIKPIKNVSSKEPILAAILLAVLGSITALHQAYVEFFGYQIIPFHLTYMLDTDFITANYSSILNIKNAIFLTITLLGFFHILRYKDKKAIAPKRKRETAIAYSIFLGGFILIVGLHSVNIRYKFRLFIPEDLQVNFYESLFKRYNTSQRTMSLTKEELKILQKEFSSSTLPGNNESSRFPNSINSNAFSFPSPIAIKIKESFGDRVKNKKKPIILVLLLESARASDFGVYNKDKSSTTSITPTFDKLAEEGILFTNAYSTGTVTRAAQEAVWCGHLSGIGSSMMRERPDIKAKCLPQIYKEANRSLEDKSLRSGSFWLHGGKGEYDSQEAFWKQSGVDFFMSQRDFSENTPNTGWGISDLAFFERSISEIKKIHTKDRSFQLGMMLSMTNHIPWKQPSDTPKEIKEKAYGHPSHNTTRYTDYALGKFIHSLKSNQIWDDLILVIAGDHGAMLPSYHPYPEGTPNIPQKKMSHIAMLLTGGVVKDSLNKLNLSSLEYSEFVSNGSIAPFIAYVTGHEEGQRFMMEMLLSEKSKHPVAVNLGKEVYFPKEEITFSKLQLAKENSNFLEGKQKFALLFYRRYLELINRSHPQ